MTFQTSTVNMFLFFKIKLVGYHTIVQILPPSYKRLTRIMKKLIKGLAFNRLNEIIPCAKCARPLKGPTQACVAKGLFFTRGQRNDTVDWYSLLFERIPPRESKNFVEQKNLGVRVRLQEFRAAREHESLFCFSSAKNFAETQGLLVVQQ